jgi:hypothetical protein
MGFIADIERILAHKRAERESHRRTDIDLKRRAVEAAERLAAAAELRSVGHHIICEWHLDQYPWECTCGATAPRAAWFDDAARQHAQLLLK